MFCTQKVPAKETVFGQWRVPADTVIQVRVYPQNTTLLGDLHVDVSKYRRRPDRNIPHWMFYLNDADGLTIQTKLEDEREEVIDRDLRTNRERRLPALSY